MPLVMVCVCGHAVALPEKGGRYRCSRCSRLLNLTWFDGPRAYEKWQSWRLWSRTAPAAEDVVKVEWRVEGEK